MAAGFSREEGMSNLNTDLRKIILGLESRGTKEDWQREWADWNPANPSKKNGEFRPVSNLITKSSKAELMAMAADAQAKRGNGSGIILAGSPNSRHSHSHSIALAEPALIEVEEIPAVSIVSGGQGQGQQRPRPPMPVYNRQECWTPESVKRTTTPLSAGSEAEATLRKSSIASNMSMGLSWPLKRNRPTSSGSDAMSVFSAKSSGSSYFGGFDAYRASASASLKSRRCFICRKSFGIFLLGAVTGGLLAFIFTMAFAGKNQDAAALCGSGSTSPSFIEPAPLVGRFWGRGNGGDKSSGENSQQQGTEPENKEPETKTQTTSSASDSQMGSQSTTNAPKRKQRGEEWTNGRTARPEAEVPSSQPSLSESTTISNKFTTTHGNIILTTILPKTTITKVSSHGNPGPSVVTTKIPQQTGILKDDIVTTETNAAITKIPQHKITTSTEKAKFSDLITELPEQDGSNLETGSDSEVSSHAPKATTSENVNEMLTTIRPTSRDSTKDSSTISPSTGENKNSIVVFATNRPKATKDLSTVSHSKTGTTSQRPDVLLTTIHPSEQDTTGGRRNIRGDRNGGGGYFTPQPLEPPNNNELEMSPEDPIKQSPRESVSDMPKDFETITSQAYDDGQMEMTTSTWMEIDIKYSSSPAPDSEEVEGNNIQPEHDASPQVNPATRSTTITEISQRRGTTDAPVRPISTEKPQKNGINTEMPGSIRTSGTQIPLTRVTSAADAREKGSGASIVSTEVPSRENPGPNIVITKTPQQNGIFTDKIVTTQTNAITKNPQPKIIASTGKPKLSELATEMPEQGESTLQTDSDDDESATNVKQNETGSGIVITKVPGISTEKVVATTEIPRKGNDQAKVSTDKSGAKSSNLDSGLTATKAPAPPPPTRKEPPKKKMGWFRRFVEAVKKIVKKINPFD